MKNFLKCGALSLLLVFCVSIPVLAGTISSRKFSSIQGTIEKNIGSGYHTAKVTKGTSGSSVNVYQVKVGPDRKVANLKPFESVRFNATGDCKYKMNWGGSWSADAKKIYCWAEITH